MTGHRYSFGLIYEEKQGSTPWFVLSTASPRKCPVQEPTIIFWICLDIIMNLVGFYNCTAYNTSSKHFCICCLLSCVNWLFPERT